MRIHVVRYEPVLYDRIWHVAAAGKVGGFSETEATFSGDCVAEVIMAGALGRSYFCNLTWLPEEMELLYENIK